MYNLNINKSSVVPTNLIVGRVLDKPFDVFQFKIFNGLDPLDLTGATLDFRGVTPDNKKVISTAVKITDAKSGEIEFTIPSNFYSASGKFRNAYFRITKSGQTESTNDLLINVLNAVDLNLEDSQIIIDQLDKIIKDAMAKLDKELANVKLQISQVDGNIKALKKDVEDYKATFKVQMDAMQKRLDDLAKSINQTDIQRPQITSPTGNNYIFLDDANKSLTQLVVENIESGKLGLGIFKIQIYRLQDWNLGQIYGLLNIISSNVENISYTFTGVSSLGTYSTGRVSRVELGWNLLDNVDIPNATTSKSGLMSSTDKVKLNSIEKYDVATQTTSGLMSSTDKKKLDGLKNYNNATQTTSGLMSSTDKKKLDNSGLKDLLNQEAYYGVDGVLTGNATDYEFLDITAEHSGNRITSRYKTSTPTNFNITISNVYNDVSSTGFEVWEIEGDVTSSRVSVSRCKGLKVGSSTTPLSNTSDIKVVGIQGINKIN